MLSALRPGTPVYVLYKNEPRFAVAKVSQVSNQYPNLAYQQPLVPGNNVAVDIAIEVDGKMETYQRIPLNSSVAEFPDKGVLISETRDGIVNEVNAIRSASQAAIDQVDAHRRVIESCDRLLFDLNPQLKKDQEQAQEIANLKQQLAGMSDQIAALTGMLSKSLGKTKKEE
ncbi:MAG: hypothetical protein J6T35_03630 [Bacteroidales bacterium]|nr:hypothetical protein [Bacteroidales bacterium]